MGAPRRPIPATKVCTKCHRELPFTREYFPPCGPSQRHLGGLYRLACADCNHSKCASTIEEWRERCPTAAPMLAAA